MRLASLLALTALFPIALGPSQADAQARIGSVGLELGSSKQEVLSSLRGAYQVENKGGSWAVTRRSGEGYNFLGSVQFADGRLVAANRDWMPEDRESALAVVQATINALTSVAESTDEPCRLERGGETRPEGSLSRIEIRCGIHGVAIEALESRAGEGVTVSESWRLRSKQR